MKKRLIYILSIIIVLLVYLAIRRVVSQKNLKSKLSNEASISLLAEDELLPGVYVSEVKTSGNVVTIKGRLWNTDPTRQCEIKAYDSVLVYASDGIDTTLIYGRKATTFSANPLGPGAWVGVAISASVRQQQSIVIVYYTRGDRDFIANVTEGAHSIVR